MDFYRSFGITWSFRNYILIMCTWGLNEWGDIANIVIAVASMATAIVTAIVLCKQHKLQKQQHALEKEKLNAQQLEHQPSFHSEYIGKEDKRVISCDGFDMWTPAGIELTTIIAIQFNKDSNTIASYYIPIRYYTSRVFTYKIRGELAIYTNNDILNNAKLGAIKTSLYNKLKSKITDCQLLSVFESDIVKIKYTDQYHIKREVYFLDNDKSTEQRYNEFLSISKAISSRPLKLQDIDVEKHIQEILKMKFIQSLK